MSYVLVVEDDPLGADAARDFLASAGHSVHVVPTPVVAARLIVWSRRMSSSATAACRRTATTRSWRFAIVSRSR